MNTSAGGLSRRRGVAVNVDDHDAATSPLPHIINSSQQQKGTTLTRKASGENISNSRIGVDPRDLEGDGKDKLVPRLTLLEEVLLLGLKDKQV